jgi:hypothetical protein
MEKAGWQFWIFDGGMQIILVGIADVYEARALALKQYKGGHVERQSPLSVDDVKKHAIEGTFLKLKNINVREP